MNTFFDNEGKDLSNAISDMITDGASLAKLLCNFADEKAKLIFVKKQENLFKTILQQPNEFGKFIDGITHLSGVNADKHVTDIIQLFSEINGEFLFFNPALSQTLIKKHTIKLELFDVSGLTLLHHAAKKGEITLAQFYIKEYKIPPNTPVKNGTKTPLQIAIEFKQTDAMEFLLFEKIKNELQNKVDCYVRTLPPLGLDDFCFYAVRVLDNGIKLPNSNKHAFFIQQLINYGTELQKMSAQHKIYYGSHFYEKVNNYIKQLISHHITTLYRSQNASFFFAGESLSSEKLAANPVNMRELDKNEPRA